MSQENVEIARRAFDAFNRRDLGAFLAIMDAQVEAESRFIAVEGGYRGHEGVRRWWQDTLDAFPDMMVEAVEVRDRGEMTLSELRIRGHGAGSGIPIDVTVWHVSHVRGGKSVWWRIVQTPGEAIEALRVRD